MKSSSLRQTVHASPLDEAQRIRHGAEGPVERKKTETPLLPLTSLIDAFSIIVIYLLIGTQNGGMEMSVPNRISLPTADSGVTIEKAEIIVRIENGNYFVNEEEVGQDRLGARLAEIRKDQTEENAEILVQADQKMDFAHLDPLLRAGSEAGIQKIKFAVAPKQ